MADKTTHKSIFTWQIHGDGKHLGPGEVVDPDERLTWPRTIGIGMQHVIAMFGATFLVPILTGFDPSTTLFFTAFGTALFLLINKNRLPSYLGSSFGLIAPITAVTAKYAGLRGMAMASFGIMCTGLTLALIGIIVHFTGAHWIDVVMPPIVTGAIVSIIGFNLAPSVWNNWKKAPDTAAVTLVAVLLIAVLFRGLIGRLNILFGVMVGYIYACIRGQVDFKAVAKAAWIGFPEFRLPVANFSVLAMFIPVVLVLIAENIGHIKSVSLMTGRNYDGQIGSALFADGLSTMISGFGGGVGTTTYAENIGVMAVTKVYSTLVFVAAALIAMLLGFSPKFGALIHTIPGPVIGGASIVVFGLIAVAGARIWVQNRVDLSQNSNLIMVSVTLVLGAGDFALSLGGFTLGGIGTATFGAILLHALLHRGTREAKEARVTPV